MQQHSLEDGSGRAVLLGGFAAYAVVIVWQAYTLPARVPQHIGPGEEITWGTRSSHLTLAVILGLGTLALFWLLPLLVNKVPTSLVNMPHKEHWTAADNWPRAQQMMRNDLSWLGGLTFVFLAFVMWGVGQVAEGGRFASALFLTVTLVYSIGVSGWAIWSYVGPRWKPKNN